MIVPAKTRRCQAAAAEMPETGRRCDAARAGRRVLLRSSSVRRRCACRRWRRTAATTPITEGRVIAANIPGARFVGLEGKKHLVLESDPGWPLFQEEVGAFLAG